MKIAPCWEMTFTVSQHRYLDLWFHRLKGHALRLISVSLHVEHLALWGPEQVQLPALPSPNLTL